MQIHRTMKEDVSTNVETTSLSTIFKELTKLERDFRYQETLYRLKSEELDKANSANIILKEHLESAYREIETLRNNVQILDCKFNELDMGNIKEKDVCEQVIRKLTEKISALSEEHKAAIIRQEAAHAQSLDELKHQHTDFVAELQHKYGNDILEFQQELEREKNYAAQLTNKLEYTREDNLILQNKLREVHQNYLPMEAYKTQLRNLMAVNEKLKTEIAHLNEKCSCIQNENAHLQQTNLQLNQVVNLRQEEQGSQRMEQQEAVIRMQNELKEMKDKYATLLYECDKLKEENTKSQQELESYQYDYCNVAMHKNIMEQNQILQELVKEMRKERMKCSDDQLKSNLNETEARIQRLEELIFELKRVLLNVGQPSSKTNNF